MGPACCTCDRASGPCTRGRMSGQSTQASRRQRHRKTASTHTAPGWGHGRCAGSRRARLRPWRSVSVERQRARAHAPEIQSAIPGLRSRARGLLSRWRCVAGAHCFEAHGARASAKYPRARLNEPYAPADTITGLRAEDHERSDVTGSQSLKLENQRRQRQSFHRVGKRGRVPRARRSYATASSLSRERDRPSRPERRDTRSRVCGEMPMLISPSSVLAVESAGFLLLLRRTCHDFRLWERA